VIPVRPDGGGDAREQLRSLFAAVARAEVSPEDAVERVAFGPVRDLGFARLDTHRELRQGAPEAVLAEGKTPAEVRAIVAAMLEEDAGSVLVTRADAAARAAVRSVAPDAQEDERARLAWVARSTPEPAGLVAIVSAGTSDAPAVREAQVRAELLGAHVVVQRDVGVAGLHRLVAALPDLDRADCVVVVAGQDAALASVVGGLVSTPVIAVPTSTGYGASFGGVSALLAMITSCAAGVAVVNIDDGFGAGTIAARIARAAAGAGSAREAHAPGGELDGR
jgi:NCAIR mutase (PurE)-related protein